MTYQERMDVYNKHEQEALQQYSNTLKMLGNLCIKYDINYEDYTNMVSMIFTSVNVERELGKMMIKVTYGVGDMENSTNETSK